MLLSVEAYLYVKILTRCFESLWTRLTDPLEMFESVTSVASLPHAKNQLYLLTQCIPEIKLTHYLLSIWACSGMPQHNHLKQPTNTLCFLGPLIISKNSTSYLKFFVRYCGLKNPAFWGFWIITQEPDFCKHVALAKSTKKHWHFVLKWESISKWIRFLPKS